MSHLKSKWLALLAGALVATGSALAQDSGALIDLLVKKGIVTDQEAEDLRADLTKEFATTNAGKLNLSGPITEIKFSGDLRARYEYNAVVPETATGGAAVSNETSRQRFRFRFNTDVVLQKGWTTGFAFETAQASDSGNQTFTGAGDDYGLFLAKAYIGFQPSLNWAFGIGKVKNPFYTTDLRWDGDINPQGAYESYKAFFGVKDTLEVRAMQHAMQDNNEQTFGPLGRDAWMFEQQAAYTHWYGPERLNNLILAVGFATYNQSNLPTTSTITPGNSPLNSAAFVGTTRAQQYFSFTGEANWANINGAGTGFKVYWDSSINLQGETRAYQVYNLNPAVFDNGDTAWLAGVGYNYGSGKVKGDYSFKLDYRSVGITSIDPNTNDSDFNLGKLNTKGLKFQVVYNLNDFTTAGVSFFDTNVLQAKMTNSLGNTHHTNELLVDLVLKY